MTQQTKMPEPVAWTSLDLRRTFSESEVQILEREGGSRETQLRAFPVALITTDQAEAYKDACVREALEEAAQEVELCYSNNDSQDDFQRRSAAAIRALIPTK